MIYQSLYIGNKKEIVIDGVKYTRDMFKDKESKGIPVEEDVEERKKPEETEIVINMRQSQHFFIERGENEEIQLKPKTNQVVAQVDAAELFDNPVNASN